MSQAQADFVVSLQGDHKRTKHGTAKRSRNRYDVSTDIKCGASCDGNWRVEYVLNFLVNDHDEWRAISSANSNCSEPRGNQFSCSGNYGV